MQEASFSGLFKTIIYIIGFYYFVKIMARIFMPMLMRKVVEKAQDNFNKNYQQGNFNQSYTNESQPQENTNRDFKKPTKQVGDYVDYEEVND